MIWLMLSFQIAVIAYVYAVVLTKPGMLLDVPYSYLTQVVCEHPRYEWFLKPLMLCQYCVAGQMALWTLILYGGFHLEWVKTVIDVLFFLSLTILFVTLLSKLLND